MLGQSNIEKILIHRLHQMGVDVIRSTSVDSIELSESGCFTKLSDGKKIQSTFVIGADGSRSFVRSHFNIPFEIERPQLIWAVIDGVIESDLSLIHI